MGAGDLRISQMTIWGRNLQGPWVRTTYYSINQGVSNCLSPLLSVPPLIFTRSDFEGGRIWPAAGGKFWGISGASKGETLQKVTLWGPKFDVE